MRRFTISALMIVVVLIPVYAVFARTQIGVTDGTPAEITYESCKDEKLLALLGDDLRKSAASFKKVDLNKPSEVAQLLLDTQALRRKWEEMPDLPELCVALQLRAARVFASGGDLAALTMASAVDKANATTYNSAMKRQVERFAKTLDELMRIVPRVME